MCVASVAENGAAVLTQNMRLYLHPPTLSSVFSVTCQHLFLLEVLFCHTCQSLWSPRGLEFVVWLHESPVGFPSHGLMDGGGVWVFGGQCDLSLVVLYTVPVPRNKV